MRDMYLPVLQVQNLLRETLRPDITSKLAPSGLHVKTTPYSG
jgi:hypothetical protein